MQHAKTIIADIKKGVVKPIYFLTGVEPFFIDQISNYIEDNLLDDSEKAFNQVVLYGRDVTIDDIVLQAKRYPMMAERQVMIIKEAQELARTIEQLEPYIKNAQPSTILVICYKYKKIDKRKKLYTALKKFGLYYESKKLYDNQVVDWVRRIFIDDGYQIQPKAAQMLVDYLGNDLSKIQNELKKLMGILPKGSEISPEIIEVNIGISKDFNVFELRKAICFRDFVKAQRIAQYFTQNPKEHPLVLTVGQLYSLFVSILKFHALPSKDKSTVARGLGISPFFADEYITAGRNYPMKKASAAISLIREVDVKSKGVGATTFANDSLLKELLARIMS